MLRGAGEIPVVQPFELDLVNASARKAVSKVAFACHFRLKT